jgi:integrase
MSKSHQFWISYRDRNGKRCRESTGTEDWQEANRKLRERLEARDGNLLEVMRKGESLAFEEWVDCFLENYSKPPIRAAKTHEANLRCATHLKAAFSGRKLVEITADAIEDYLRRRLRQRVRIKLALGYLEKGILKSSTVHQEFRVLRRMLNVAVRKRLLPTNPCAGVEFPVAGVEFPVMVKGLFRPHYVTWSEQRTIEAHAPEYLRNIVRIITETGLRVYKELMPMKKEQLDLTNAMVWIPDSKTPNGVAEVPLTPLALEAFRDQIRLSPCSPYLFPSDENPSGHQKTLKTSWQATLRRAQVPGTAMPTKCLLKKQAPLLKKQVRILSRSPCSERIMTRFCHGRGQKSWFRGGTKLGSTLESILLILSGRSAAW